MRMPPCQTKSRQITALLRRLCVSVLSWALCPQLCLEWCLILELVGSHVPSAACNLTCLLCPRLPNRSEAAALAGRQSGAAAAWAAADAGLTLWRFPLKDQPLLCVVSARLIEHSCLQFASSCSTPLAQLLVPSRLRSWAGQSLEAAQGQAQSPSMSPKQKAPKRASEASTASTAAARTPAQAMPAAQPCMHTSHCFCRRAGLPPSPLPLLAPAALLDHTCPPAMAFLPCSPSPLCSASLMAR